VSPAGLLLGVLLALAGPPAARPAGEPTVLRTVEGKVAALGEAAGEGSLPVVTLQLSTPQGEVRILVAPAPVLADLGFSVKVGDEIRARIFLDPATQAAYAQKLLNRSQDLMVRLRTLRHEPLWDATGAWQGSPAELPVRAGEPTRPTRGRARGTTERRPPPPPPPPPF